MAEKYPVYKIEDVYHFEKYDTKTSPLFNAWAWVQLTMILLFISYLFGSIAYINSLDSSYIYWYGAFVFLSVYALTELDRLQILGDKPLMLLSVCASSFFLAVLALSGPLRLAQAVTGSAAIAALVTFAMWLAGFSFTDVGQMLAGKYQVRG